MNDHNLLARANSLMEIGDISKALELCLAYLENSPDDIEGLRFKAKLLGLSGDINGAVEVITKTISSNSDEEPCDYFYRGRWLLRDGKAQSALRDFEAVIRLSKASSDSYYLGDAYLHEAVALLSLGKEKEACLAVSNVGDDCRTSINGVVISKRYILSKTAKGGGVNRK